MSNWCGVCALKREISRARANWRDRVEMAHVRKGQHQQKHVAIKPHFLRRNNRRVSILLCLWLSRTISLLFLCKRKFDEWQVARPGRLYVSVYEVRTQANDFDETAFSLKNENSLNKTFNRLHRKKSDYHHFGSSALLIRTQTAVCIRRCFGKSLHQTT